MDGLVIGSAAVLNGAADRILGKGTLGHTTIGLVLALLMIPYAYFAFHLSPRGAAAFPLPWLVWRVWEGWTFLGGSINPAPGKAQYTFLRHCLTLGFLFPAWLGGLHLWPVAGAMLAFAAVATLLAVINYFTLAKANGTIEILRGCALGAALAAGFVVWQ